MKKPTINKSQAIRKPVVNTLFFDIETSYVVARLWRLGEQTVRHDQLVPGRDLQDIICIAYAWNDEPVKILHWDYQKQDSRLMIREFDKLVKQADVVIGKNSDRFDVKHVNTQRLVKGLSPFPEWVNGTDDLEKQLRKHFAFPSYSLDYVAKLLLGSGKIKMEFSDWVKIVERDPKEGMKAFRKMLKYNKKDVEDTRAIWKKVQPYITPKLNCSALYGDVRCVNCGSEDVRKNGTRLSGSTLYQHFYCGEHGGYAGKVAASKVKKNTVTQLRN